MPNKLSVACLFHGILVLNLSGLSLKRKKLGLMMIDFAGLSLLWKNTVALGYWSCFKPSFFFFPNQVLFWIFKGIEPNSECTGTHIYCETVSFCTGVFRTYRVQTELL